MMTILSDAFPEEHKMASAERTLRIGAVLRLPVTDTTPPKLKRMIVIGFNDIRSEMACIYINSEINTRALPTTWMQQMQLSLQHSGRAYLEHNSFADCLKLRPRALRRHWLSWLMILRSALGMFRRTI